MKLITFLGTGDYKSVKYVYGTLDFETDFFSRAVAEWKKPSIVLVLLTETAKKHSNWEKLQERFESSNITLQGIDIPEGRNEAELWGVFQVLAGQFEDEDEIIFDVTHAFRSLPVLVLLAANYLRVVRDIKVQDVLYGAYEKDNPIASVFSLMPFMNLLDWVTATDKFVKSGDAGELGQLLKNAHNLPYTQGGIPKSELPTRLSGLSGTLGELSSALRLTRPREVVEHAMQLRGKLTDIEAEVQRYAPPFGPLLNQISKAYLPFSEDSIAAQLDLINWYVDHGQDVQAITLMSEWLISWVCKKLGRDLYSREQREDVGWAITTIIRKWSGSQADDNVLSDQILQLDGGKEIVKMWNTLSDLRNDVAHCGMREGVQAARRITQSITQKVKELNHLYHPSPDEGESL